MHKLKMTIKPLIPYDIHGHIDQHHEHRTILRWDNKQTNRPTKLVNLTIFMILATNWSTLCMAVATSDRIRMQ